MSALAYRVAPRSRREIRKIAEGLWAGFTGEQFPIVYVVDVALSRFMPGYHFLVLDKEQMPDVHGLTNPDQPLMIIRNDVYEGANAGVGRDRFTLAHELGHLWLHKGHYLERMDPRVASKTATHKKYEDSEWQADTFASELLMPVVLVKKCSSAAELATRAGVSQQAAEVRIKVLKTEGLL